MNTHTPGPWKVSIAMAMGDLEVLAEHRGEPSAEPWRQYSRRNEGHWVIVDDDGNFLALAAFQGQAKRGEAYRTADPEGLANARLIAAAPDLLAALEAMTPDYEHCAPDMGGNIEPDRLALIKQARAAIVATKGETK